jgi:soluble lytic murein transglycosylase
LRYLTDKFEGETKNILAAYNAGPGRVQGWLKDKNISSDGNVLENIPFEETRQYVDKIVRAYEVYKSLYKLQN